MIRRLAAIAALSALASVSVAQPAATRPASAPGAEVGPAWATLSASQRQALGPLQAQWSSLDAARKAKWLVVAKSFPTMPEDERQRVQARMAEWARMSPVERGRARQNFQELRNLPAGDRQALWEAYRALPEEQRRELALRAKAHPAASEPVAQTDSKRRVAISPRAVTVKPVSPTVVQAKPGGTTTLVTKRPAPPAHHQPGMPKILASKDFVNPATLLPNRGPQGAAVSAPPAASEPAPSP
ncbi:MAG: DUF3106 domain-containing protein [Rubrivivax sp.]